MNETSDSKIPCCPALEIDNECDVLDFHYRLKHNTEWSVGAAGCRWKSSSMHASSAAPDP